MPEPAPGLFLNEFVPKGRCYVMNNYLIGAPGVPPRCLAINPADWERVPPAERERLLDEITRKDAQRGLREFEHFLGGAS